MPPKQGSGKKKLSKAEKEKMKKEEAERKAQEEEEARLLAEQEQKEMKKREKLQEIERKKLELEEKKYRKIKMAELNEMLDGHKSALKADNDHRRKTSKWERYMRTDGSPDPTVQGEINTYINLRREDNTANDIDSVLRDGKLDLELIEELEFLLEDNPEETLTPSDVAEYKHTISELQDLLKLKLDAASHQILLKATALQDPETLNLQFCQRSDQISLCVWGNLCKNPRVKSFEFSETGFMFEIPKQLTLAECAFRILSTKYDHYSLYCKTFMPRIRKPEEPEPEEPEAVNQTEEVENGEGQGEELAEGEEPKPEEEEPEKEDTMDLMASLREANTVAEDEEGGEAGEEERPEEPKEEEDEWTDPVTPEPTEWDDFDGDDDEVDLRAYHVIGGVFDFNLLHLPPQPKTVNSWTMTQMVIPPELMYMDYVAELSAPVAPSPSKEVKEGQEEKKRDEKPPIGVTMRLAEDVFFMEEPQVARWDHDNKCWKLDGFTDIKYFDDERKLKFKANGFGTMALLQDFHINMPFQSWEIRPHNANSCVLTIIAAIVELEIEIKGAECCLSKPDDRPELKHLLNKWMQPSDLIKCMQAAGVNVFPAEDSSKYVSIQEKSPIVEERLYEQMALTCAGMAYSWSKWNSECGDRDWILFQGAEAIEDEPLLEEDWSLYLVTKRRAMKLKMTEYDETFSDILADNTDFQCNLYHLMKFTASEKVNERIEAASYQYIHCVQQVLSATKFLTFA